MERCTACGGLAVPREDGLRCYSCGRAVDSPQKRLGMWTKPDEDENGNG